MDEVLVHITAPTTRKDDEIYRSMADAYRAFENYPLKSSENSDKEDIRGPGCLKSWRPSLDEVTDYRGSAITNSSTSKGSYGSFPSYVSSGPLDISPEPSVALKSQGMRDDSVFNTSHLVKLERIQEHWKEKNKFNSSSSGELRSAKKISTLSPQDTTFIEDTQLAAQAVQSQLPDNYSATSADTSDNSDDEFEHAFHSTAVRKLNDVYSESLSNQASPEMVPVAQVSTPGSRASTARSNGKNSEVAPEALDFTHLLYEVLPPGPTISAKAPSALPSQMTTYLDAIRQQNHDRFKPSRRSRSLDMDERGCWLVETTKWPQEAQYGFWTSLCGQVSNGHFGWGVFLYREQPPNNMSTGLGQVRVYCWGEIVEEIWLALWICSQGKISGSAARWLDAAETVVIQVP